MRDVRDVPAADSAFARVECGRGRAQLKKETTNLVRQNGYGTLASSFIGCIAEHQHMIDTPEILQTAAQQSAAIRLTIPRSEIQRVIGPGSAN
ncbi:MAG TPA: hypothetical protein VF331_08685 [Polyangiales bacterium]